VSAADEGGATFHVQGARGAPLQVSSVSCGGYHTAAATIEGEVFTWGANGDGQLGLGDMIDRGSPFLVKEVPFALQVACGGRHSLILTEYGAALSCGSNSHQQLGRSAARDRHRFAPVAMLLNPTLTHVACGGAHCAAVSADGRCFTWGKNQNGQLGHGDVKPSTNGPQPVEGMPRSVVWVSCGGAHTAALVRLPESDGVMAPDQS